jgi:hypothetical protein
MLPISEKRLAANRANAAHSTGPTTPEGKARSAKNALRHGLLAKQILIGKESAENFQALFDILVDRFAPVDDFELGMIEELASSYWRLRRAWCLETEILETSMEKQPPRGQIARMAAAFGELAADNRVNLLHRYEGRLHRMYQRTLQNLVLLRQFDAAYKKCKNEPKTPIPINKSSQKRTPKTAENSPKPTESAPNPAPPAHSPKEPFTPTPTPSSQIMEPSDIINP